MLRQVRQHQQTENRLRNTTTVQLAMKINQLSLFIESYWVLFLSERYISDRRLFRDYKQYLSGARVLPPARCHRLRSVPRRLGCTAPHFPQQLPC